MRLGREDKSKACWPYLLRNMDKHEKFQRIQTRSNYTFHFPLIESIYKHSGNFLIRFIRQKIYILIEWNGISLKKVFIY